jgi:hypothetical protein
LSPLPRLLCYHLQIIILSDSEEFRLKLFLTASDWTLWVCNLDLDGNILPFQSEFTLFFHLQTVSFSIGCDRKPLNDEGAKPDFIVYPFMSLTIDNRQDGIDFVGFSSGYICQRTRLWSKGIHSDLTFINDYGGRFEPVDFGLIFQSSKYGDVLCFSLWYPFTNVNEYIVNTLKTTPHKPYSDMRLSFACLAGCQVKAIVPSELKRSRQVPFFSLPLAEVKTSSEAADRKELTLSHWQQPDGYWYREFSPSDFPKPPFVETTVSFEETAVPGKGAGKGSGTMGSSSGKGAGKGSQPTCSNQAVHLGESKLSPTGKRREQRKSALENPYKVSPAQTPTQRRRELRKKKLLGVRNNSEVGIMIPTHAADSDTAQLAMSSSLKRKLRRQRSKQQNAE